MYVVSLLQTSACPTPGSDQVYPVSTTQCEDHPSQSLRFPSSQVSEPDLV